MKILHCLLGCCVILMLALACEKDSTGPESGTTVVTGESEAVALDLMKASAWEADASATAKKYTPKALPFFKREVLTGDIVHYSFQVKVGVGTYDVIGIHRVVKETKTGQPIKTKKNLFLQHGDSKDFTGMFLNGVRTPNVADDFGIAIFLARNDIDVWGIDQNWTLVPASVTDFTFMKDWGIDNQVSNLRFAMEIARFARTFSGCGNNALNLSGYSSGVLTGYALLNEEAKLAKNKRVVAGWIPVDCPYKCNDPKGVEALATAYQSYKAKVDAGDYVEVQLFPLAGQAARDNPDGASALIEGFTNLQVAMYFCAAPVLPPIIFHYFAGIMESEFPVDLQYLTKAEAIDFLIDSVPYEADHFELDYCAIISDAVPVPWDDNLGSITVPVFNVAAAGGMGDLTPYTTTLLGSTDVQNLIVRLHPAGEEAIDFGHIDLFMAHNAEALVWTPILNWVKAH
ncbi:MAG TPA: hypothetical protein PLG50_02185 [bacterium]|nr:hypothetical protein [bacterium]HQG44452.1 hypothetical protein [bacterium]HQI47532.1 hypothetical protein [bacterium]HQJ63109.1 hypothetical protein [bacterium]